MRIEDLNKGWRIRFKTIKGENMQFMESPIYSKEEALEARLEELFKDPSLQEVEVVTVRYWSDI